jgi:molybdopterin molybdotransferase
MLKRIDPDHALQVVLEQTPAGAVETVPVLAADGRILAEAVQADRDYPPFDRAMMDGFAVRVADAGELVEVRGEVAAGVEPEEPVEPGTAVSIMTGAPCPPGTEAVVPIENVEREGGAVRLPSPLSSGTHIVTRGYERRAGDVVAPEGTPVTPLAVAVLVSVGRAQVQVTEAPTLAVISTGDEVVAEGAEVGASQIRNSNGPMLAAMARELGVVQATLLHARDTEEALDEALVAAADADITLLSGGVSAGRYDLVPDAVRRVGAEVVFHKVTQKPGKPLLFARRDQKLFFGLPGNPLSSHFCFHRYVAAAIRKITGRRQPAPQLGRLTQPLSVSCKRTLYVPSRVTPTETGWEVAPLLVGSANIFACVEARVYVRLEPGVHELGAGAMLPFFWM